MQRKQPAMRAERNMADVPLPETISTYDAIAADYAQVQQDRRALAGDLARFVRRLPPDAVVLDVGCGPGFDTAVLRQQALRAFGLDLSQGMLQAGREMLGPRLPVAQADMRRLPVGAASVDGIWALASLLHLPETAVDATLADFRRALRPGGVLYLSVKRGHGSRWVRGAYGHDRRRFFRFWTPTELDLRITAAGFVIADGWTTDASDVWLCRIAAKS